jgi:hypothetical protein
VEDLPVDPDTGELVKIKLVTDIQSGWATFRGSWSTGEEDRCRPAPARHRWFTEWGALRLLAC